MEGRALLGIFDSGVGGFSVLKEIRKTSNADILYFGDCARAPYGNRSETEIVSFIKEILLMLKQKGVTHFLSACNSMSVHTTDMILQEVGITRNRYIDMIDAVKGIAFSPQAKVLIIGTNATLASGVYQNILVGKGVPIEACPLPLLASSIEMEDEEGITESVAFALKQAGALECTHVLYACTHYPLVGELFKYEAKRIGWTGEFIDPARYLAEEIKKWNVPGTGAVSFETSKETPQFKNYSARVW